jgi:hypothetical protein
MPVKLRKAKGRTALITDEAVAIYKDALKLRDIRWDCSRSIACRSPSIDERCAECVKYGDLDHELDRLLGIKPWERSPLDIDGETPPDYMRHNPLQSEYWHKAWAVRCELDQN